MTQKYCNQLAGAESAFIQFPVDFQGGLIGFELEQSNKRYIAKIKIRDEEVSATLRPMEDKPETFICNIGRLEPNEKVEIKVTYVTQLLFKGDSFRFTLPATMLHNTIHSKSQSGSPCPVLVQMEISMHETIASIESLTSHPIRISSMSSGNACVEMSLQDSNIIYPSTNFTLSIKTERQQKSWCSLEYLDTDEESIAAAIHFQLPQTQPQKIENVEVICVVDLPLSDDVNSNVSLLSLQQFVTNLLSECDKTPHSENYLNVVLSSSKNNSKIFLFPEGSKRIPENKQLILDTLRKQIENISQEAENADNNNPNISTSLKRANSNNNLHGCLGQIFSGNLVRSTNLYLWTDGNIPRINSLLKLISRSRKNVRIFPIGIGDNVTQWTVRKQIFFFSPPTFI